MSAVDLARLQFALTTSFHFLFVLLTLGLVTLLVIMQTRFTITGAPVHERMTRFWGRIYVINYALGIVTGIVIWYVVCWFVLPLWTRRRYTDTE